MEEKEERKGEGMMKGRWEERNKIGRLERRKSSWKRGKEETEGGRKYGRSKGREGE